MIVDDCFMLQNGYSSRTPLEMPSNNRVSQITPAEKVLFTVLMTEVILLKCGDNGEFSALCWVGWYLVVSLGETTKP